MFNEVDGGEPFFGNDVADDEHICIVLGSVFLGGKMNKPCRRTFCKSQVENQQTPDKLSEFVS